MSFRYMAWTGDQAAQNRSLTNRRACVRYRCGLAMPGRVIIEGEEWQRAWVLDLCLNGVGLLLSRPLQPGLKVVIRLESAVQKDAYDRVAGVRHVTRQADGDWVVGFEFANKLTDDELDALLQ